MTMDVSAKDNTFFTRDKEFYKSFFKMMILLAAQNIITYTVNVADNVMLGRYSQTALAGASAINQLQYILQMFVRDGLGSGLLILASRAWGKKDTEGVRKVAGIALSFGIMVGIILTTVAILSPYSLARIFTDDAAVLDEAVEYLSIIRYTYIIFIISCILIISLQSIQIVGISFRISCLTLVINVVINYLLIFGHFGAPEMGIKGAAIGTLVARIIELIILLLYIRKPTIPVRFSLPRLKYSERVLIGEYIRVSVPCVVSALLFSSATAVQTVIFGHISVDAMAAASVAGVLYQYCKMIPSAAAGTTNVHIGKTIGSNDMGKLRSYVRTLQVIFAGIGVIICIILLILRKTVLQFYVLTPQAYEYALQMTLILAIIAIGMSYQAPCQIGIIRGGGDTRYVMISDIIYSWLIVIPLSLIMAFVLHMPFAVIAICLNCDQILKCITVSKKVRSFTWIKKINIGGKIE